jgi:hypothetical protein
MPITKLYHIWFTKILQMYPNLRITQQRNLAWMLAGIYQSRSVQLQRIAGKIPGAARLASFVTRLTRFIDNPALQVRPLYEPVARQWLDFQAQTTGGIRLVIDGTKVGSGHQLLMVALLFRKRAVPLVWTWMRCAKGHSSARKQLALLAYLRPWIPDQIPVILVGDTEFEGGEVQRQLNQWGWKYVLRQKPNNQVQSANNQPWQSFGDLVTQPGQSVWLEKVSLTLKHALSVNLLAHWEKSEKVAWLLATNLPSCEETLKAYRCRMWIEEMFGDMKQHGFDLESTHLQHFLRLSRLTLIVSLLYAWLITTGVKVIKNGLRYLVDKRDRMDLSIFQIGFRLAERRLINMLNLVICLNPNYSNQSVR